MKLKHTFRINKIILHTSAATVAIMPKVDDLNVKIEPKDIIELS